MRLLEKRKRAFAAISIERWSSKHNLPHAPTKLHGGITFTTGSFDRISSIEELVAIALTCPRFLIQS